MNLQQKWKWGILELSLTEFTFILNLEAWVTLVAVALLNMVSIKFHLHSSSTLTNKVLTFSPFLLCAHLTPVACARVASNSSSNNITGITGCCTDPYECQGNQTDSDLDQSGCSNLEPLACLPSEAPSFVPSISGVPSFMPSFMPSLSLEPSTSPQTFSPTVAPTSPPTFQPTTFPTVSCDLFPMHVLLGALLLYILY